MTGKKEIKEEKITENSSCKNQDIESNESSSDKKTEIEENKVMNKKQANFLENLTKEELIGKVKNLEEELKLKKNDLESSKDWKEKFIHLQAEFENSQKRWNKEKNNLRLEYIASVLKKFLPLYDSYKKALMQDPNNASITQFFNQFMNIFQAHDGAKVMNVKVNDPFDYHYHEALSSVEREGLPNNSIIDIIQDGWMIGESILRYAKVITSRKPKPPEQKVSIDVNEVSIKINDIESSEKEKEKESENTSKN